MPVLVVADDADTKQLIADVVRLFAEDTAAHPLPRVVSPRLVLELSIARLIRVTLKLAGEAKVSGVPVSGLRRAYEFLEVPVRVRDLVERKLVQDGVVKVSGDRLFFVGTKATWNRLAGESA
jgi:hypothetical protein